MLRKLNEFENYKIGATDGEIGHVKDFYFQEAGSWLSSRKVLISPISVRHPDWLARTLPVSLTQEQVKNSPSIDTDQPVSRQNEAQILGYYGYPNYWGGVGMWGEGLYPYAMVPGYAGQGVDRVDRAERERELEAYLRDERARHRMDDPHLRSCKAVTGYDIHALDGEIGHVSGFLVDDESWAIRYLVVDTSNWWVGHKVLIAPPWIKGVHWADQSVAVDLSREAIQNAPPYDAALDWGRDQELMLYRHHGRRGYWPGSIDLEDAI